VDEQKRHRADQTEALEDFFEVKMTKSEIRRFNRELELAGMRICENLECQHKGEAQRLVTENFEQLTETTWRHVCRRCVSARETKRFKTKYDSDEEYRKSINERNKEYRDSLKHPPSRAADMRRLRKKWKEEGR
jgi:hypothetical protein